MRERVLKYHTGKLEYFGTRLTGVVFYDRMVFYQLGNDDDNEVN